MPLTNRSSSYIYEVVFVKLGLSYNLNRLVNSPIQEGTERNFRKVKTVVGKNVSPLRHKTTNKKYIWPISFNKKKYYPPKRLQNSKKSSRKKCVASQGKTTHKKYFWSISFNKKSDIPKLRQECKTLRPKTMKKILKKKIYKNFSEFKKNVFWG